MGGPGAVLARSWRGLGDGFRGVLARRPWRRRQSALVRPP